MKRRWRCPDGMPGGVSGRQSVEFDPSRRRYIESRVVESP
jgi:hypothetical protein